jgi:hypothetical protein
MGGTSARSPWMALFPLPGKAEDYAREGYIVALPTTWISDDWLQEREAL